MDDDYNTLDDLHSNIDTYGSEDGALVTAASSSSCFMLDSESICTADFSFSKDPVDPLKYSFSNSSSNVEWQSMTYYWDFNDEGGSTATSPTFTFSNGGVKYVTLTVYINGNECSEITKVINTSSCNANFTYAIGASGLVNFQNTSQASEPITAYYWDFDDTNTSTEENPTHTYIADDTYDVTLTIVADGNSNSYTKTISITNAGADCKNGDRTKEKYDVYIEGSRKAKYVFAVRNVWPFHRVIMKTINYKIVGDDNERRVRADVIGADFYGALYRTDCSFWFNHNLYTSTHIECNEKIASYNEGQNQAFRIRKESVKSWHKVVDEGITEVGIKLYLHDDD